MSDEAPDFAWMFVDDDGDLLGHSRKPMYPEDYILYRRADLHSLPDEVVTRLNYKDVITEYGTVTIRPDAPPLVEGFAFDVNHIPEAQRPALPDCGALALAWAADQLAPSQDLHSLPDELVERVRGVLETTVHHYTVVVDIDLLRDILAAVERKP
jgi:hypothetical protein